MALTRSAWEARAAGASGIGNFGGIGGKLAKKREKVIYGARFMRLYLRTFHGDIFDIFRLGKPLQVGLHPPPWA
jgi:hypothetical protein